ncbi:MAG: recombinase family protein [Eubacteriales bacterium]|nr:recombinase family protein [Eubacteriales bacterium]
MSRYAYMLLDQIEKEVSRQAMQLDTIGNFDKIYVERLTPRSDKLEQRQKLLDVLVTGDVVFAAAADRFCRQSRDFLDVYFQIEAKGAELVLLEDGFDSRSATGRQSLKILRTFAELDFEFQSERKKQGIQIARGQGRRIGRPPVAIPAAFRDICQRWSQGQLTGREAAALANLRSTSFYKKAAELGFKAPPRQPRPKTTPTK